MANSESGDKNFKKGLSYHEYPTTIQPFGSQPDVPSFVREKSNKSHSTNGPEVEGERKSQSTSKYSVVDNQEHVLSLNEWRRPMNTFNDDAFIGPPAFDPKTIPDDVSTIQIGHSEFMNKRFEWLQNNRLDGNRSTDYISCPHSLIEAIKDNSKEQIEQLNVKRPGSFRVF